MARQFIPRKDEWYWYFDESTGKPKATPNWGTPFDQDRIKNGNSFKTKREVKLRKQKEAAAK